MAGKREIAAGCVLAVTVFVCVSVVQVILYIHGASLVTKVICGVVSYVVGVVLGILIVNFRNRDRE